MKTYSKKRKEKVITQKRNVNNIIKTSTISKSSIQNFFQSGNGSYPPLKKQRRHINLESKENEEILSSISQLNGKATQSYLDFGQVLI